MQTKLIISCLICVFAVVSATGCSTLSSLGLPVGRSENRILDSAKAISGKPGMPILAPKELLKQPLDSYILEVGDTLFVEPAGFDSTIRLPGDQVIKPDGTISLGEFGSYYPVNKTIDEIRIEIQSLIDTQIRQTMEQESRSKQQAGQVPAILQDPESVQTTVEATNDFVLQQDDNGGLQSAIADRIKQNQISVRLVSWDSKRVYVLGEVNSPGFFSYTGSQTVLDAIIEAGGLTSKANHHQIIVSRPTTCGDCRVVMQVCYDQIVQLGDTSTNYQLHPGDRVFVPGITFADDLKKSLFPFNETRCPRCAPCQQGCDLPTGCN